MVINMMDEIDGSQADETFVSDSMAKRSSSGRRRTPKSYVARWSLT
jgi:hypothetical protein